MEVGSHPSQQEAAIYRLSTHKHHPVAILGVFLLPFIQMQSKGIDRVAENVKCFRHDDCSPSGSFIFPCCSVTTQFVY